MSASLRRPPPPSAPIPVEPVAASHGVAAVLRGPRRPVRVLAAFPAAVYLAHADGLVALVASDGVHQPNALIVPRPITDRPLADLHVAQRGEVGEGALRIGGRRLQVARWFDPVPRLAVTAPITLTANLAAARASLAAITGPAPTELTGPLADVVAGLHVADTGRVATAARRLVGLGPGLTPAGDDVLAGLFAGTLALLPAITGSATTSFAGHVHEAGHAVAELARDATTAVSAALLGHAVRGEVAAPAAAVLHALTGRGAVPTALSKLLAVGSTSGRDLALGLLAATDLVLVAAARGTTSPTVLHELRTT